MPCPSVPASWWPRIAAPLVACALLAVGSPWARGASRSREPRRAPAALPGQQLDGSVLLPNQWSLRPAGRQLGLGDFPVHLEIHPEGRYAAVLHCGYGENEIVIVDLQRLRIVSRTSLEESFYGLAFSRDGQRLYASGAGAEVIHAFRFDSGLLAQPREIRLRPVEQRGFAAGLAVSRDGSTLWAANLWGHRLSLVSTDGTSAATDVFLGASSAVATATDGDAASRPLPPTHPDLAAATKRAEALLDPTTSADPFPYGCVLDEPRHRLYVSLWAHARIAVIDTQSRERVATWTCEEHPNEMVLSASGRTLFVANANRNTITVIDVTAGRTLETLFAAMTPDAPPGSTPNSLALAPDDGTLFVANACNNNLAVFDVREPGHSKALGFIPVGWYPTSVRVTPDGKRLVVANGKGQTSRSNRHGPQPGKQDPARTVKEYLAGLLQGSLSVIDLPRGEEFEERLKVWTQQAYACSPAASPGAVADPAGRADRTPRRLRGGSRRSHPIPARLGDPSPIQYCLYVVKENRTYDQVLGDLPEGNGDPALCLFPESITPNHHALAREFVLLDNFYVESEVSADGHEWTLGAYASDFVEKIWPLSYGHNGRGKLSYPAEGRFAIAMPSAGYLWDAAQRAGISFRSYGSFVDNGATPEAPATTRVATLVGHFDPGYRAWDMDYPDVKRAERFISELQRYEREGDMPRLQILRLPNDHTFGTTVGKPTPKAMLADNDLAFGRLVEAVTRSKFWARTAIFVVEDDAQNGPDHVDAHRTIAYTISPYVRRGSVDSTMYSTCSMLRTLELILGIPPMSQFDAAARPMHRAFQVTPDLRPYTHRPVTVDLTEKNLASAWGTAESSRMDFSKEDAADDLRLNEVVWRSVRGPDQAMPAPVRAAFVFALDDDENETEAGNGDRDEDEHDGRPGRR